MTDENIMYIGLARIKPKIQLLFFNKSKHAINVAKVDSADLETVKVSTHYQRYTNKLLINIHI